MAIRHQVQQWRQTQLLFGRRMKHEALPLARHHEQRWPRRDPVWGKRTSVLWARLITPRRPLASRIDSSAHSSTVPGWVLVVAVGVLLSCALGVSWLDPLTGSLK